MRFKLNREGVRELLMSAEMQAVVSDYANAVQGRAGDGFTADVKVGKRRCYANIAPSTYAAYVENNEHNTLLKAIS